MAWLVGVDVGGTFTDFYALDAANGVEHVHKTPSTPDNPARAIVEGLRVLAEQSGIPLATLTHLAHGTTVGTNALIQRKGGSVAVITTEGFKDLLEIGRQVRPKMYDIRTDQPAPLAPRHNRFEIAERIGAGGVVVKALSDAAIAEAVASVVAAGAQSCAVCLLFSYVNPDHERRVGEALQKAAPNLFVSISSEVQPEFREYERFSTALLNAYLQPLLNHYMTLLRDEVARYAPKAMVGINQSSGGLMSVERARQFPIRTALSGPAAGAIGAIHVARQSGRPNVVTLDMGGTSADVCLIRNHEAGLAFNRDVAGFPVRLPMVDINTIGAGGGSIAWFDRDGLLKVGPISAGAVPGPACYGKGGDKPTVSDANLVLGRLSEKGLLGGRMKIDPGAARRVIQPVADQLGFTVERTAQGILGIVCANMVRAIRAVSVERGHDPRDFALMPFGGAGALHATEVARALGIREILVPQMPGILCAQGLVVSDLKEDMVRSLRIPLEGGEADTQAVVDELAERARAWFDAEGVAESERKLQLSLDMRYVGQNFELRVPVGAARPAAEGVAMPDAAALRALFFAVHEQSYGFYNPHDPVEIVNFRLTAKARLAEPPQPGGAADPTAVAVPVERRPVRFDGDTSYDTPVYDRATLKPGMAIAGPAVIDQLDATTLVYPGDKAVVDTALNILIEVTQ